MGNMMKAIAKDNFESEYKHLINDNIPNDNNLSYRGFVHHINDTSDYYKQYQLDNNVNAYTIPGQHSEYNKEIVELYKLYKEVLNG